jgi:hypothetical protein
MVVRPFLLLSLVFSLELVCVVSLTVVLWYVLLNIAG